MQDFPRLVFVPVLVIAGCLSDRPQAFKYIYYRRAQIVCRWHSLEGCAT